MARALNLRQLAFIDGLFAGKSRTQAYMDAFALKPRQRETACTEAGRVYRIPAVREEIDRRRRALDRKHEITAERVLDELATLAFAVAFGDLVRVEDGRVVMGDSDTAPDHLRRCVASVGNTEHGIKVTFHDRLKALAMLGEYLGLLKGDGPPANAAPPAVIAPPEPMPEPAP